MNDASDPPRPAWTPAEATDEIRAISRQRRLNISYRLHAREQLGERGLIISDVLYALKNGFVHDEPEPATRKGFYRYRMESRTPNSGSRRIRVVVIPDKQRCSLKIVTVMWVDEKESAAGSIIGG
jgi:hypothetical protein